MDENLDFSKNIELNKALEEFEAKASIEQIVKYNFLVSKNSQLPRMVRLVMKLSGGAIKEQKQAEYVLIVLIVLMFALSFYFFFGDSLKQNDIPVEILPDQTQFIQ